jgi:hypothetical protein
MRSSIFGSDSEWKVILTVLAVLGAAEALLRAKEALLSIDLLHIQDIPKIAQRLAEQPHPRILFVGNSLTREGIDEPVLEQELRDRGCPASIEKIFPDNTQIAEWYYAFKRNFVNAGRSPDFLIISCPTTQLRDQAPFSVYGLGRHWIDTRDVPEVLHADVTAFGDQVEFFLSRLSVTFANRFRISGRILVSVIPGHEQLARQVNRMRNEMLQEKQASVGEAKSTYKRLHRLAELGRAHGTRLILAAMPVGKPYEIDPALVQEARAAGAVLLDCRKIPGINNDSYRDGFHLKPEGAEIYTRFLAAQIASILKSSASQPTIRGG